MKWMRLSARLITVLWAGFWIFFAVGSWIDGGRKADISASESLKGILAAAAPLGNPFSPQPPRAVKGYKSSEPGIGMSSSRESHWERRAYIEPDGKFI